MSKTSFDSVNKIWSGSKLPSIYNSNVSLGYLILNVFQNTPDAITQVSVDTGIELTCRQMYQKSINMANYLQELGCKHGDVAGFVATNSDNLAPIVFACLTLGLPINGLHLKLSDGEMIFFYSKTKPKIIFCDADVIQQIERVVKELQIDSLICTVDKKVEGIKYIGDKMNNDYDTQTFRLPNFNSDSVAFILTTSGTSDNPKQVCKTHKAIIEEVAPQWKSKLTSQEIWLVTSGIHWISGIWQLIIATLYGGKRIITSRPDTTNVMAQLIAKYKVTTLIMIPPLFLKLYNYERKELQTNLKIIILGGITVTKDMCEKARLLFPNCNICPLYGSTEGGFLTMNLSNRNFDSVGQLYKNVEMKILDDNGCSLGVGEIGEIVYKASVLFQGYFDDPNKTAETVKDGWIFSGDVGFFDKEGFLFLTDRKKDLFKSGLSYVSPTELETIINTINDVNESCVVAVYQENIASDLIFAFVVKKSDSELSEQFIEEYVSERVIYDKQIKGGVHFVDCLPVTATGKIRRVDVRNWAKEKYRKMNL